MTDLDDEPRQAGGRFGTGLARTLGSTLGLLTAGVASLAVFVAATPSLLVFPRQAFFGSRGMFFGVRQYGGGGWIGVQPDSNARFYGRLVVEELGLAGSVVAVAGLVALVVAAVGGHVRSEPAAGSLRAAARRALARLAWLAPFPIAYLALIVAMNMVVRRNLVPAVPPLAAFAGVGVVAAGVVAKRRLAGRLAVRRGDGEAVPGGRWGAAAAVVLAALLLLAPASRSLVDSFAMARPSTRELARAWLLENAPPGSAVVRESYGPELPAERFAVWRSRFAARFLLADLRAAEVDYLVLASAAYRRFLDEERHARPHHATYGAWYRQVFADTPEVARFAPGRMTWGPLIRVHRLPGAGVADGEVWMPARGLFVPDGGMRVDGERHVRWFRPGQWSLAKADLGAGTWRVELVGEVAPGGEPRLEVRSVDPGAIAPQRVPLAGPEGRRADFRWSAPGRAYLYLHLPEGSSLRGLRLSPVGAVDRTPSGIRFAPSSTETLP